MTHDLHARLEAVERRYRRLVRLGGGLPDAVYDGRTVDRGSAAAGLILYDAAGDERGGYVTMDGSNNIVRLPGLSRGRLTRPGRGGGTPFRRPGPTGPTARDTRAGPGPTPRS